MDEKSDGHNTSGFNRRTFLGALGGVAASAAFLKGGQPRHADPTIYYEDSFGNIVPAALDSLAAGVYPPPLLHSASHTAPQTGAPTCTGDCQPNTTCVTPGFPAYNILLIMVDQLRAPRWLTTAQQNYIDTSIAPNIAAIRNMSYVFSNYFVAATACSPSRATLLTGLYSQQQGIFVTEDPAKPYPPSLQPYQQGGFPSIGDVLSQSFLNYNSTWIGKWHLSANPLEPSCFPGSPGPAAYGFSNPDYTIPGNNPGAVYPYAAGYNSPNGGANEGNSGDFLDVSVSKQNDVPQYPASSFTAPPPPCFNQLNDAAIADAFVNDWLPWASANLSAPGSQKWFTAVSFINPHDMAFFPYSFGLTESDPADFGAPKSPPTSGYQPPPAISTKTSYNGLGSGESTTIAAMSTLYKQPPANWNYPDNPATQPYQAGVGGKPGLQAFFQTNMDNNNGSVKTEKGWLEFLNYYFWMVGCVDIQIGNVLNGPAGSSGKGLANSPFWSNTVIIFTSDHGDYGGSHSLHAKAGALYDESINVPLYISFPGVNQARQSTSISRNFVCSSVDMLPFIYSLALGNDSWRCNGTDIINYLNQRESINDAINSSDATQRRVAVDILNSNGVGNPPYILHTTDEFQGANGSPSHAVAFRTVDLTTTPAQGGAKLGIYSFWKKGTTTPVVGSSKQPQQYEFYNYNPVSASQTLTPNPGETGNQAFASGSQTAEMTAYLTNFNDATVQNELNLVPSVLGTAHSQALTLFLQYIDNTETCGPSSCPA